MAYNNEKSAVGENLSSAFGMMDGIENDILSNAVNAYHKLLVNAFEDIGETSCMISDMKCGGYPWILDDKEVWIYCVSLNDSGDTAISFTFYILNWTHIYIVGGIGLAVIVALIVTVIILIKRKNNQATLIHIDYDESIADKVENDVFNAPQVEETTVSSNDINQN